MGRFACYYVCARLSSDVPNKLMYQQARAKSGVKIRTTDSLSSLGRLPISTRRIRASIEAFRNWNLPRVEVPRVGKADGYAEGHWRDDTWYISWRAMLRGMRLSDDEEPIAMVEETKSDLENHTGVIHEEVGPHTKRTKTLKDSRFWYESDRQGVKFRSNHRLRARCLYWQFAVLLLRKAWQTLDRENDSLTGEFGTPF